MRLIEYPDIIVYTDDVLGHAGEWRSATLHINPASFGMAVNCCYTVFVSYRRYNFNIQPPHLPEYQATTWDIIGQLENVAGESVQLTPDEQYMAEHLQYGITYEEHARFNKGAPVSANPNRLNRFSYMLPLYELPRWYLLHPRQPRCITDKEFAALADDNGLMFWLRNQVALHTLNYWHVQDYSSKFNARAGKWEGTNYEEPPRHKTFDLVQYVPPLKPADMFPQGLCLPKFQDYLGRVRK